MEQRADEAASLTTKEEGSRKEQVLQNATFTDRPKLTALREEGSPTFPIHTPSTFIENHKGFTSAHDVNL